MRTWLFHPLIFYPLAALLAVLVIAISLRPQSFPHAAAPVAGLVVQGALVLQGAAFNSPAADPSAQYLTVKRNFLGQAQTLRIAQLPGRPSPTPQDRGVRIMLDPEQTGAIAGRAVTVEVSYLPSTVNAAAALAVSLQGGGAATWAIRPTPPQAGALRFELPPQANPTALGLRAISSATDEAYGLEITRIRLIPHSR